MTIEAGQQLLHYRLIEQIGEGGMGVVWLARDTSLDRNVAIKVLPAGFATDVERLARFEREAKLLASLNHLNIAGVYGLHEQEGLRFIAMELVEGEDLATRLARGALAIEEALGAARQIASALAAAHDNGVVHRDLKPANIRLTPDGTVKVLDFGLAKALDPHAVSGSESFDPALSPTITSAGTRVGMILGTAAYMSPEQARGKTVDRRADTWAFGCVLYEALTGRQAFVGETVTDVLASILTKAPDMQQLAARAPRRLVRLLERCLEKDPAKRLRDAGDIGLEIDTLLAGDLTASDDPGTAGMSWTRLAAVAVGAMLLGAALTYIAGLVGNEPTPTPELRRLTVSAGEGQTIRHATISRDGSWLLLGLDDGAYVRRLDSYELQPIADSKNLQGWVESPDGGTIVFFNQDDQIVGGGKLRRASLDTGQTVVIRDKSEGVLPTYWGQDGILALDSRGPKVWRLRLDTGAAEELFDLRQGHFHGGTMISEDRALLASVHDQNATPEWSFQALDLASGKSRTIAGDVQDAVVTPTGHLLFARQGNLIATPFDREALETVGLPVPILSDVMSFSVSDNGTLAYLSSGDTAETSTLLRVDRGGEREVVSEGDMWFARYAPDGRRVAVVVPGGIDVLDLESGSRRPLRNPGYNYSDHVWRADGKALIHTGFTKSDADVRGALAAPGRSYLLEQPLDGGPPQVLLESESDEDVFPTGYAPDGSGLVFARYKDDDADLWWLPADASAPRPLLATEHSEDLGRFSPDTGLLAYESAESGRQQIWVGRYHARDTRLGETWRVSVEGGKDPIWSPDGRELYFEDADDRLMRVIVDRDADNQPFFAEPEVLFDLRAMGLEADGDVSYDVSPSGEHWLFYEQRSPGSTEVRVVLNWFPELERLVREGG